MISDKKLTIPSNKKVLNIQMDHILAHEQANRNKEPLIDTLNCVEKFLKEKGIDTKNKFGPRGAWTGITTSKETMSRISVCEKYIDSLGLTEEFLDFYKKNSHYNGR